MSDELRRIQEQTGFTASLESFDLLDVTQIISLSHKNITLLIHTGPEEHGTLHFHNGDLTWAEFGVLHGEEAFFALAVHQNGTVTQQLSDEPFATNVAQPLSRLIFQALQYRTACEHKQQPLEEEQIQSLQSNTSGSASPPIQFLPDNIDDSPFVFTSKEMASNDPDATQHIPQVADVTPAFSVPQEPFPPIAQFASPVIEQMNTPPPDQFGNPPPAPTKDNAANPYEKKILLLQYPTTDRGNEESLTLPPTSSDIGHHVNRMMPNRSSGFALGLAIASVLFLVLLSFVANFVISLYTTGKNTGVDTPKLTVIAQARQKNTPTPTPSHTPTPRATPTPTSKATPTPIPQLQPTQKPKGVNGNPWGYDFNPGNLIYNPPEDFCTYFDCVKNFWDNTNGYVEECNDGTFSHSGGVPSACARQGGEMRPLYSH